MVTKKINERVVLLSVFILLAVFALGILFVTNPKMTGQVVLEDYTNETSCVDAGYTWENLINETCTDIPDCIECVVGCEPDCTTCIDEVIGGQCVDDLDYDNKEDCENATYVWEEIINETCTDIPDCIECVVGCEPDCTTCVDEVIGGQCIGDVCGDGEVQAPNDDGINETCDDGENNGEYNYCAIDCLSEGPFCGDGGCNSGEDCSSCSDDCGECESDDDDDTSTTDSTNGESNVVTGDIVKSSCVSNWQCSDWTECVEGMQTRTCTDTYNCVLKTTEEPSLSQECEVIIEEAEVIIKETCVDEIKNQDEEGIDCGGVCEKRCSVFTMVGSVISGPIESGKEFFQKNKTIVIIILGFMVLGAGGFLTFEVLKKKGILPEILPNILPKIKMLFKKNLEKPKEAS